MSSRGDVTSLDPAHMYPWVASQAKLVVLFDLIGIFSGK